VLTAVIVAITVNAALCLAAATAVAVFLKKPVCQNVG